MRSAFSVAVYPRFEDRVLLIRHRRLNTWLPPGGELEPGETPLAAAVRELVEETGLRGVPPITSQVDGTPPGLIGYEEHIAGSKGLHMNFVFVFDVETQDVRACEEFTDHAWVTIDDPRFEDAPPNVKQLAVLALSAPRP